jgi:transmembrane sensor
MDSKHRQAERQAADWLCRRDSGQWSVSDESALEAWLEKSSVNAVAFVRLEAAWKQADRYKALGAGFPPRRAPAPEQLGASPFFAERTAGPSPLQTLIEEEEPESRPPAARLRARWPFAIAASLAMMALATVLAWQSNVFAPTYRTPVGGFAQVPMTDGSRVTLNTDTEVRMSVTDTERSVKLERGEAFFEVARDSSRPFIVYAGTRRVMAVGTQFSVRRMGEDIRVVVTEGAVRMEEAASPQRSVIPADTLLEAGGVARADGKGIVVQSRPLEEVREALSWRAGLVIFRDVDLTEAVAEFNRYNAQKIVIQDPVLAAIRLSGKFKATNADAFVRLLEDGFPIEARQEGGRLLLTSARR